MRTVEIAFTFGQDARVPQLDLIGKVVRVYVDHLGITYDVRYFINGESKTCWFFQEELAAVEQ